MADLGTVVSKVTRVTTEWIQHVNDLTYRKVGLLRGADPTGVTDATSLLKALFDECIPASLPVAIPGGTYKISGPITSTSYAAGSLHIVCIGDVTLAVDSGSTPFDMVIRQQTTAISSASVRGGRLTINCNNKAACGLYVRHLGAQGGTVDFGPVEVLNVFEDSASPTFETTGISVSGRYTLVRMEAPRVDGVDRTAASGVCKGIAVSEVDGVCAINAAYVARVLAGPGTADADGIAVFGYAPGGAYDAKNAIVRLTSPTLVDVKGRSMKFQSTDVTVDRPAIYRQAVVTLAGLADVDFQGGGDCHVITPYLEYRKNGGVSPLGAGFYPFALQANCENRPNRFSIVGGTFRSEVDVYRVAILLQRAAALNTTVDVDGLVVQPLGVASVAVSRAFFEVQADQVQASSATSVHVNVRNCRANISGYPLIGTTAASSATASTFSFEATGNVNLGAVHASTRVIGALSGSTITTFGSFRLLGNVGIGDYMGTLVFDYQTLTPGNIFTYDIASSTDTNAPGAMAASGYAVVEVLSQPFATAGYRNVRVVVGNPTVANTVFQTQSGTWGAIK